MSLYAGLSKADVELRARALDTFARWSSKHKSECLPSVALEGVGFLWELLPAASRERPVDATGVQKMHAALACREAR